MKTILLAALAIVASVAPLHAKKTKFTVENVTIVTANGNLPAGAAKFREGDTVSLKISSKKLKGPKKINLKNQSKSITDDLYRKDFGKGRYTVAVVRKDATTGKPTSVDLTYFGSVKPFGSGQVTYTLVVKN